MLGNLNIGCLVLDALGEFLGTCRRSAGRYRVDTASLGDNDDGTLTKSDLNTGVTQNFEGWQRNEVRAEHKKYRCDPMSVVAHITEGPPTQDLPWSCSMLGSHGHVWEQVVYARGSSRKVLYGVGLRPRLIGMEV